MMPPSPAVAAQATDAGDGHCVLTHGTTRSSTRMLAASPRMVIRMTLAARAARPAA